MKLIRRRLYRSMSVFIFLCLILTGAVQYSKKNNDVRYEYLRYIADLIRSVTNLQETSSDYFLKREKEPEQQWYEIIETFEKELEQILEASGQNSLVKYNERDLQLMLREAVKLRKLFKNEVDNYTAVNELREKGADPDLVQAKTDLSRRTIARFSVTLQALLNRNDKLHTQVFDELSLYQGFMDILNITALIGLMAFIVFNVIFNIRKIIQPLNHLMEWTEIIGRGNLDYQIDVRESDGFEEIAEAFNKMVKNLNELTASKTQLNKEIDMRKKSEDELLVARLDAERSSKARSELFVRMGHELRTPLNSIMGFSELMQDIVTGEKEKEYTRNIREAGTSLISLINDILDLSRLDAGMMDLKLCPLDVVLVIREIQGELSSVASERDVSITVDIHKDFPRFLYLDEIKIRQILMTLTRNGIRRSENGYVKITASLVEEDENGVVVEICVEDTGFGIPQPELMQIFKDVSGRQKLKQYGISGLGLIVSSRLAEFMSGKLMVESEMGTGSRFMLQLRDVKQVEGASVPENHGILSMGDTSITSCEGPGKKKYNFLGAKVLIVDDVQSNRLMLSEILKKLNMQIVEGTNGEEALQLAEEFLPDLIIMDIQMPVMDGIEAAGFIKEKPALRDVPIIALTASITRGIYNDVEKLFAGYVRKPFDMNELTGIMASVLTYEEEGSDTLYMGDNTLFADLNKKVIPRMTSLSGTIVIEEIKNLAMILEKIGVTYNSQFIIQLSEELKKSAFTYDLMGIQSVEKRIRKFIRDHQKEGA